MAVPSESAGVEYPCQIINLHPLHDILRADLVLGGDSAHPVNLNLVVMLQAMQVK